MYAEYMECKSLSLGVSEAGKEVHFAKGLTIDRQEMALARDGITRVPHNNINIGKPTHYNTSRIVFPQL